MEWEVEVADSELKEPPKPKSKLRLGMIVRYVIEAEVFGFIGGAIGYGIHSATGFDIIVSYIVGIVLTAGLYLIYLVRILGAESVQ